MRGINNINRGFESMIRPRVADEKKKSVFHQSFNFNLFGTEYTIAFSLKKNQLSR